MNETVLGAVIGGVAVILAAVIAGAMSRKRRRAPLALPPRDLFLFGSNIAKLGWAKALGGTPESANLRIVTRAMTEALEIPSSIRDELESFLEAEQTLQEVSDALPQIKDLIGTWFASKHGEHSAGFYALGFNVINLVPMCEIASMGVNKASGAATELLADLIALARRLDLPTSKLRALLEELRGKPLHEEGLRLEEVKSQLISVGQQYMEMLGQRGA